MILRIRLSLQFQNVRFSNMRFEKIILKNVVKRLAQLQFGF
jgi:hypothetical protein